MHILCPHCPLKHPLCVGAARRVILDQLGFHHQRTFADQ
jgi:hypothetical protein